MKRIEIFDPAMCCPTGLCGPNINPDLMRIAAVLETLKRQGIVVERHNLRDEPQLYVSNKTVNDYLMKEDCNLSKTIYYNNPINMSIILPLRSMVETQSGFLSD